MQPEVLPAATGETTRLREPVVSLRANWREYLMEAACLGLFMVSAAVCGALLDHPQSLLHQNIENDTLRRVLAGVAMGTTALFLIRSPWGRRSGAHMNPAVTSAFLSLGKIKPVDAMFYVVSQFVGGLAGLQIAYILIGPPLGHMAVNFVATHPGEPGLTAALIAETFISLVMMSTVLLFANHPALSRWTPFAAATLVAAFISIEAPLSGMSMNPARTFASAVLANDWTGWWIYAVGPLTGMLLAARIHLWTRGKGSVFCAKLHHHQNDTRCIFRCKYGDLYANKQSL